MPFGVWMRTYGRVEVCRWVHNPGGYWRVRQVRVGWLPDGSWWVHRTGDGGGWVFTGPDQRRVRAVVERMAARMRDGTGWVEVQPPQPGTQPPRPADVAQWPPGFEPG